MRCGNGVVPLELSEELVPSSARSRERCSARTHAAYGSPLGSSVAMGVQASLISASTGPTRRPAPERRSSLMQVGRCSRIYSAGVIGSDAVEYALMPTAL